MFTRKSLDPSDSMNQEILRYLTMFTSRDPVILNVFNFFRETPAPIEMACGTEYFENNKREYLKGTFTDAYHDGSITKGRKERRSAVKSESPSSHPPLLDSNNGSSLEDLTETRTNTSFACTEHMWDSDRKYSISRFNYNGEVYDEIMKRMSNEDSHVLIKDNTKVEEHQFLTYQIIIKTSDSIYFIKPKDKKCFLLNKSSVSEMVAPTKTFNSAGDEISVAKFAFVELKNGSTSNSQKSIFNNDGDTYDSRNLLSSSDSEPYNRFIIDSQSDSEQTIYTESQLSLKRWERIPESSEVLTESFKRVIHQRKKMSFAKFSRPYHFNNIILYSTAVSCDSESAFQNRYFTFLKNKIKNKFSATQNQNRGIKQSSGDQSPENKNTALTAEYVNHLWEKNKQKDFELSFNLEPGFYHKSSNLKQNRNPQNYNGSQATHMSEMLSHPSKHDSLLSTLLDLKLRDIMSYVWNSSSRMKLGRIDANQEVLADSTKRWREDLQETKKVGAQLIETAKTPEKETDSLPKHVVDTENKSSLLTSPGPSILSEQDSINNDSIPKIVKMDESCAPSQSKKEENKRGGLLKVAIPTCIQENSNTTTEVTSKATSLCVNTYSSTHNESEDVLQTDYSFNRLTQLKKEIEDGDNNCVLALVVDECTKNKKQAGIVQKIKTGQENSQNIVEKSNEELQSLMSMIDLTLSSSQKSNSNNFNSVSPNSSNSKGNKANLQSQATLSVSSSSYGEKSYSLNNKKNIGQAVEIESIYSNVWKNQQLAHESMLPRVIPEDSVLSVCAHSSHSVTILPSPNTTSQSTSLQDAGQLSQDHFGKISRTCPESENDDIPSCCNLSVLAVESHGSFAEFTKKLKRKRTASTCTKNKTTGPSNQTFSTNPSYPLIIVASKRAVPDSQGVARKLIKRKSSKEALKKLGDGTSKGFRRTLKVQAFNSERSLKKHRSHHRYNRKQSGCEERRFISPHGEGPKSHRKDISKRLCSLGEKEFSNITCQYKNVAPSCPEGNFDVPQISSVVSVPQKRLHRKKKSIHYKCRDSNIAVGTNCEGDGASTSRKILKKKDRLRKKGERKEEKMNETLLSMIKTERSHGKRQVFKHFKFNKKIISPDLPNINCRINSLPKNRNDSESSLSSYKSVHSYLLEDSMSLYKHDCESDSSNETNKKSAIQTFIGPSAIDGMLNIINLFYARQKPDECSC